MDGVVTCVYCGMEYPKGTPTHGSTELTAHIKVCEKHPLRAAEEKIKLLRSALVGLVGTEDKKELEAMEAMVRTQISMGGVPNNDGVNVINAIHAILQTTNV